MEIPPILTFTLIHIQKQKKGLGYCFPDFLFVLKP